MSGARAVRLGDVLRRSVELAEIDPDAQYQELTVRLWGKGVAERGLVSGAELAAARRFVARAGSVVLSRIDARHGAIGIVSAELDGALVSNDFPMFEVDAEQLSVDYFGWLAKTSPFVELCRMASEGTTNRVRLKEDRFFDSRIVLPPLAEQRRVVEKLEQLEKSWTSASVRRSEQWRELKQLGLVDALLKDMSTESQPMGTLLREPPRNGLSPQLEVDGGGARMLRIDAVSSSESRFVDFALSKPIECDAGAAEAFGVRDADIFLVRYNGDLRRVAKPAIARRVPREPVVYPDKLIRLRPDISVVTPDYLAVVLMSRAVRAQVEALSRTTAGNLGINGRQVRSLVVPVASPSDQAKLVERFDRLVAIQSDCLALMSDATNEVDELRKSTLACAFAGAL